jgi:hypothetical protein
MIELIVLLASTTPLIVGLYALRKINERRDEGSDDQPPPPDVDPPTPPMPDTPRGRHRERPALAPRLRAPIRSRTSTHRILQPSR